MLGSPRLNSRTVMWLDISPTGLPSFRISKINFVCRGGRTIPAPPFFSCFQTTSLCTLSCERVQSEIGYNLVLTRGFYGYKVVVLFNNKMLSLPKCGPTGHSLAEITLLTC